jgi:hypothetical protein
MKVFKKKFWKQSKKRKASSRRSNKAVLEPLEPRLLLSADLAFQATDVINDLTVRMQDVAGIQTLQIVNNADDSVVASQSFAETDAVVITGGEENDALTVDYTNPFSIAITFFDTSADDADTLKIVGGDNYWNITGVEAGSGIVGDIEFFGMERLVGGSGADSFSIEPGGSIKNGIDGGGGQDTLYGPDEGRVFWTLEGSDRGEVDGIGFESVEYLVGADTASDLFAFESSGSITGGIDGGAGMSDGIKVQDPADSLFTIFNPIEADSAGILSLHGRSIAYTGMDGRPLTEVDEDNLIRGVYSSFFDDHLIIEDTGTASDGQMKVRFEGADFYEDGYFINELLFTNPSVSLSIFGLDGNDLFEVQSLDTLFTADLLLYGGGESDSISTHLDTDNNWIMSDIGSGTVGDIAFSEMEALIGGAGTDTIFGPDLDTDWVLTGSGIGMTTQIAYTGVEKLVGGAASDNFKIDPAGEISLGLEGGGGSDALIGDDAATTWNISAADAGTVQYGLVTLSFSAIENLIGGSLDDSFIFGTSGSLAGVVEGGPNNDDLETPPVDRIDYSALARPVTVDLKNGTAPFVSGFDAIDVFIGSSAVYNPYSFDPSGDTIIGYDIPSLVWTVTGPDEVTVAGLSFAGFENLTGQTGNVDAFMIEAAGSISGLVDGGVGGTDGIFIYPASGDGKIVEVGSADSSGTANSLVYGKTVYYANLDPQPFVDDIDEENPVIMGSIFGDTINIYDDAGILKVSRGGDLYQISGIQLSNLSSLTVLGLDGGDTINVASLPAAYGGADGADLLLYSDYLDEYGLPADDIYIDHINFTGDIDLKGGFLDAWAERITVDPGVTIETVDNDIVLRARIIGNAQIENLLPAYGTNREVDISIGAGAELDATGIWLVAQAEDRSIADIEGAPKEVDNFIIGPLMSKIQDLVSLPVKVLVKYSTANITLAEGARLIGDGTVGIYATAAVDATGAAKGSIFSIGYAQATAHADITIESDVVIDAGEAVVITSTGDATAGMNAETQHKIDGTPNPGGAGKQIAIAVGAAYADSYSHVTMAQGASITAGTTANVAAGGTVKSSAETKSGLFADGKAGLSFALEFSKADIKTSIDGSITALCDPGIGYTVKIEIDPLASPGQIGYVDYSHDRIYIGPNALATEDTVTYSNRRGVSIGNLVNGREYYVIALGDGWIQLADTETDALRGTVVNLINMAGSELETANNRKSFSDAEVDSAGDTVTLKRDDPVFNTFEMGQAVVFEAGSGSSIGGLTPGSTYYIIASTTEQDLQGNSRFADEQVVRIAETENEARAGVFIDLGEVTGSDFTFVAKHVLDSGFATGLGVGASLEAETKASAESGLKTEDTNPPSKWSKFTDAVGTNPFDKMFQDLTENYRKNAEKPKAGASGSIAFSGALAFSFNDHDVSTDILGNAVLKSNEDLEVTSAIAHKYNLSADSTTEPQEGKPGDPPTSAANNISIAVVVGITDNSALTTVHGGADLDALRAMRVTSNVSYPLLQRLDEYIPLSWGELTDSIREEGAKALTKYINTTLGLKEAFFNTWTSASAEAEKIGIAGSISVLVFDSDSQTIVKGGALLNQDTDWRSDDANPHPNQDNDVGTDADGAEFEQVVSIESGIVQQTITMTGIFSLPDLPSIDPSDKNITKKNLAKFVGDLDPNGTEGGRAGAGGSFFISVANDRSHAVVEDGAMIYSGADGGFNIKAREALLNVNLAQAYAKGGTLVIGGTVLYNGQTTDTLARLGSTAFVTGRDARIYAIDQSTVATWAGGIAKGEAIGVGISVAINDFSRTTRALIGDVEVESGTAILAGTYIDVDEGVHTVARSTGDVWAFTVAGTVVKEDSKPKGSGSTGKSKPTDPMDDVLLPDPIAGDSDSKKGSKTGIDQSYNGRNNRPHCRCGPSEGRFPVGAG